MHRLRQLEPSWFRSGQTTSLFESVMEKEPVKVDRGGILTPPCAGRLIAVLGGGAVVISEARGAEGVAQLMWTASGSVVAFRSDESVDRWSFGVDKSDWAVGVSDD